MNSRTIKYAVGVVWLLVAIFIASTVWLHTDNPLFAELIESFGNPVASLKALQVLTAAMREALTNSSYLLIAGVYIAAYTVRPMIFFPIAISTSIMVLLFGVPLGFLLSYLGEIYSSQVAFWIARVLRGNTQKFTNIKAIMHVRTLLKKNAFTAVLALRLVPVLPFDVVNYSSGFSSISWRAYTLATVIGIIPAILMYTLLAGGITGDTRYLWWSAGIFLTLIIVGKLYKKRLMKK